MKQCDLMISAPWILPVAPTNTVLDHHAMAITAGRIVDLGPATELRQQYAADQTLDFAHHMVLPGLVNAHGHAAMTLLRGAGEDQSLQDWLHNTIWPLEARLVDAEFVQLGTELAIAEMLASGTTTFADMYFFPNIVSQTADRLGIRAQVAFPVIEFSNVWSDGVADGIHKGLALVDEYRHHPRINIAFGPHAPYTVSPEHLAQVAMYANELDAQVQIHLHENQQEVDEAMAQHGQTWIAMLAASGLLGPNLQAVHMTTVNDDDLQRIADSGTRVVHCPSSNLKLASGYCDVSRFADAGVAVGLGTDGAASNNSLNMFSELRLAALLAKHTHGDPTQGDARQMLAMATLGGARALGLDEVTGSLEIGKDADFICVDSRALNLQPLYDPFAALVHGEPGHCISDVFVRGQGLRRDGAFTQLDSQQLHRRISQWLQNK